MYLKFYGLKEKPFNNTPDPNFLYPTAGHREALAQLLYGVHEHKGFIVLTGEVGTGKTTLLRTLLKRLDGNTAVAYIFNSALTFDEILEYMLQDFLLGPVAGGRVQRIVALNNFLIQRRSAGQNTVVILDEAQNLDPPSLEQIRLLSNFETTTDKLLQVVLSGQPELRAKLQLPELRQLRQRIGLRCSIPPLTPEETREYIRSRLRVAGAQDLHLFTDRALRRIGEYAGGIPRVINMICDHCLLTGYARQTRRIDGEIVERAIEYFEERPVAPRKVWWPGWRRPLRFAPWLAGGLLAAALGALVGLSSQAHGVPNVVDLVSGILSSVVPHELGSPAPPDPVPRKNPRGKTSPKAAEETAPQDVGGQPGREPGGVDPASWPESRPATPSPAAQTQSRPAPVPPADRPSPQVASGNRPAAPKPRAGSPGRRTAASEKSPAGTSPTASLAPGTARRTAKPREPAASSEVLQAQDTLEGRTVAPGLGQGGDSSGGCSWCPETRAHETRQEIRQETRLSAPGKPQPGPIPSGGAKRPQPPPDPVISGRQPVADLTLPGNPKFSGTHRGGGLAHRPESPVGPDFR